MKHPYVRVTRQQRALALIVVKNPTWTAKDCLLKAGYKFSLAFHAATRTIMQEGTQKAIAELLDKHGVTEEHLLKRLKEATDYLKVQRLTVSGGKGAPSSVEEFTDIDNAGRLAAVELGLKMRGMVHDPTKQDAFRAGAEWAQRAWLPKIRSLLAMPQLSEFRRYCEEIDAQLEQRTTGGKVVEAEMTDVTPRGNGAQPAHVEAQTGEQKPDVSVPPESQTEGLNRATSVPGDSETAGNGQSANPGQTAELDPKQPGGA